MVALFFIKSTTLFAQDYEAIYKKLETDLLLGNFNKVEKILDSIDLKGTLSKTFYNDFNALKVVSLIGNNHYSEALKLANQILKNPTEITERTLVRLYLEKSLVLEINNNQEAVKLTHDKIENIYKTRFKDRLYGQYLFRKASYYRVFKSIKNSDSLALVYVEKAIEFGESNKFYEVSGKAKMIHSFLLGKDKKNEITTLLKKSLKDFMLIKNQREIGNMYKNLGFHLLYINEIEEANKYLDSSLIVTKKRKDLLILGWLYEAKSRLNYKKQRLDSALYYYKKFHVNEMQRNDKKQEREISLINFKNQIEKEKQSTLIINTKLNETQKTNKILIFFSIGIIFLLILVVFLYNRLKIKSTEVDSKNSILKTTVREKEVLLKELNHRVKNNLSLIISLIKFQSQEISNDFYKEKFNHLENRIKAIAIAHEQFVYSDTKIAGEFYNLEEYLQKISNALINTSPRTIYYTQDIAQIQLSIDTALPIGILMNELISNSIEHAVTKGSLNIKTKITADKNWISIHYSDSGESFKINKDSKSLGLFIIDSMIMQLKGNFVRNKAVYSIKLKQKNGD